MNNCLLKHPKTIHITWWVTAWCLLIITSLSVRNYLPIDETRYVSVAWEMWVNHDFLLPTINGAPYSHKPPLMFWLFQLGWSIFGVNNWWPRLVPPLFALGCLFLTGIIGKKLWPEQKAIAWQAPTILLGCLLWTVFSTTMMFDMILTFFVLLSIIGLILADKQNLWGWCLFAFAVGFGILAKGPVMLLQCAFPAILAPLWKNQVHSFSYKKWYGSLALALIAGIIIPLLWAIPAAIKGGEAYTNEIFLSQTVGRVQKSFAHQRPWYWYSMLLPILLAPWIIWPSFWKNIKQIGMAKTDPGLRLVLIWFVPTFLTFCLISGKQLHYLLPFFPAFALFAAKILYTQQQFSRKGLLPIAITIIIVGAFSTLPAFFADAITGAPNWLNLISPWWGCMGIAVGFILMRKKSYTQESIYLVLSACSVAVVLLILIGGMRVANPTYDLEPIAIKIGEIQARGKEIVNVGKYYNQYHFLGRLKEPLSTIGVCKKIQWAQQHPEGWIIDYYRKSSILTGKPEFQQPFRGKMAGLWQSKELLKNGDGYPFVDCS